MGHLYTLDKRKAYGVRKNFLRLSNVFQAWFVFFAMSQTLLPRDKTLSQYTVNALRELDQRRRELQDLSGRLFHDVNLCIECPRPCCAGGSYNHFRALDYWLRKYSYQPIDDFGLAAQTSWLSRPLSTLAYHMKRTVSSMEEGRNGCSFLGQKGCTLERSERPIMCIFYTCGRERAQMNAEQKKSHAQWTEALYDVCLETFDVLKQEAGLPKRYGKLRLFLLPL
jgi:Fe-S-cluster containining protein